MAKIKAKGIDFATTYLRDNAGQLDIAAATAANFHVQNSDTKLANGTSNEVTAAAIRAFIDSKAQNSGLASLDSSGKIPTGQLPNLAITDTHIVASEAAMLALTAETGDVAIRTDTNESYILAASPASTLGNWKLLSVSANAVTSVNGETGAVALDAGDIPYDNTTSGLMTTNVQAAIDEVDDDLDTAEATISTHTSQIAALDTRLDTAEADIDAVEADVSTLQTDVTALDGRLDTAESDIDDLQARTNIVRQFVTLNSTHITNKAVTLTSTPTSVAVISVTIRGIGMQFPTDDFSLVSGAIDWNNSEGMDSLGLVSGDKLLIEYAI